MKILIRYSFFVLFIVGLNNCEDKPDKSFYGVPEEEKSKILTGILLSFGAQDTANGTIIDPKSGLEWKKCTQGQIFRATNNDCQGGKATATLATPADQGRYGATFLAYCNIEGNDCNSRSLPMTLKADSLTGITSEAYNTCATDRTSGYSNWRVPSHPELQALAALGKVALISKFPNTPDDYFWSTWGNEQDQSGATARAISFSLDTIGKEQNISKTTRLYVRCVRNTNGQ